MSHVSWRTSIPGSPSTYQAEFLYIPLQDSQDLTQLHPLEFCEVRTPGNPRPMLTWLTPVNHTETDLVEYALMKLEERSRTSQMELLGKRSVYDWRVVIKLWIPPRPCDECIYGCRSSEGTAHLRLQRMDGTILSLLVVECFLEICKHSGSMLLTLVRFGSTSGFRGIGRPALMVVRGLEIVHSMGLLAGNICNGDACILDLRVRRSLHSSSRDSGLECALHLGQASHCCHVATLHFGVSHKLPP